MKQGEALDILIEARKAGGDLKNILQGPRKKSNIGAVKDRDGQVQTDRLEIAEVFAKFYEALYSVEANDRGDNQNLLRSHVSLEDVRAATVKILKGMKKNKTCAEDGRVAEMLQTKHEGLI